MPRRTLKLTEAEIKGAKPKAQDYKLYDDEGLRLLVRRTGTKVWQYPYKLHGKSNIYTVGKYPEIGSAKARKLRDDVRHQIQQGIDPNQHKPTRRLTETDPHSFGAIGREWLGKQIWVPKHAANIRRQLQQDVFEHLGQKPIRAVTRQDILGMLQVVEDRGALDVAKRTARHMVQLFDYALIKGLCDNNPATGLSRILKNYRPKHRAYLKEAQIPDFLAKLSEYSGSVRVQLAMKLLMLTFVRPGELRGARWEEFDFIKAQWRIPAARMKIKREHIVPLSSQALAVIDQLRSLTGNLDLLFPGNDATKPISDVTLTKCIQILGYGGQATAHGMRAMASTILNENGFNRDAIERQLAHVPQDKIRGAYNHADYLEDRRAMMQWWGDYLGKAGV